jgi:trehalose-phosphatase
MYGWIRKSAKRWQALAKRDDIVLSIVSGREVRELRELIDVPGLIYAGNHGLQIVGKHLDFLEPVAAARRELIDTIAADLAQKLTYIPGTEVEFKKLSVAVHYRRSKPEDATAVGNAVRRAAEEAGPLVQINSGKMVWEILPRTGWNKGTATSWIYHRLGLPKALVIYVGDDRTDEDAFQRFRDSVTIRVGDPEETLANYFLQSPAKCTRSWSGWRAVRSRRPETNGYATTISEKSAIAENSFNIPASRLRRFVLTAGSWALTITLSKNRSTAGRSDAIAAKSAV